MKHRTRQHVKAKLAKIKHHHAVARSLLIAHTLQNLPQFIEASSVMLYMTIPGEVDTQPIAQKCFELDKTVVVPKPCPDTKHMKPVICTPSQLSDFNPKLGLRSPAGSATLPPENIDIIIIPALAFDRKCNRLGRGGGFYDRFLKQKNLRALKIGVAFTEQILPSLPIDNYDTPVDLVVTDQESAWRGQTG